MDSRKIGLIGLCLNSLGALLIAFSLQGGDGYWVGEFTGIQYHTAYISERVFIVGVLIFVAGFILQIFEKYWGDEFRDIRIVSLVIVFSVFVFLLFSWLARRIFFI